MSDDTAPAGSAGSAGAAFPHRGTVDAPDPNATVVPEGLPSTAAGAAGPEAPGHRGHETCEREAARRSAVARQRARAEGRDAPPDPRASAYAVRAAARAFPALAENVRDYAIFLMDPDGIITYWGEGARLMKWWTKDEAEGAHFRLLYPDDGSEDGTAEAHLRTAAEEGEYVGEGHRVRRDGSTFWAGITLTALRDEDGTLLGFSKVTRDLTARRAANSALAAAAAAERARAAAEAVSAAKSQFIATMSHEVRTPINAVLGYADLLDLEAEGPLTAGQRRYVERLRTSARHLLGLVEDVLDLSRLDRLEADRGGVEGAAGRLGDVVAAALALVEPQARQRGVELADRVGTSAARLAYRGDEAQVRQILVNLLANAVKFAAPNGGEPARVTMGAGASDEPPAQVEFSGGGPWVYVRVEDTGPGIPAEQLEAIFEPFVQVGRRSNNPVGGAGLGLAISRRLARQMGGEISVKSEVGVGATFVLWLSAAPIVSLRTGGV